MRSVFCSSVSCAIHTGGGGKKNGWVQSELRVNSRLFQLTWHAVRMCCIVHTGISPRPSAYATDLLVLQIPHRLSHVQFVLSIVSWLAYPEGVGIGPAPQHLRWKRRVTVGRGGAAADGGDGQCVVQRLTKNGRWMRCDMITIRNLAVSKVVNKIRYTSDRRSFTSRCWEKKKLENNF